MKKKRFFDRELSWLSFNYRVLQEAKDKSVPLYERIKFLAIYSSNLDEFFRVRVASLRSLLNLKKKTQAKLKFDPCELLKSIHKTVNEQQEEFGQIFREDILPELRENNIYLIDNSELNHDQKRFVEDFFEDNVKQFIQPVLLVKGKFTPFLQNRHLYLAVKLAPKNSESKKRIRHFYSLVEIPTEHLPRFIQLPKENGNNSIIFLDDVIRYCISNVFTGLEPIAAYSIKLTRDAELYIDDEFTGDLLSKIKKGLKKRNTGVPSRFLFDKDIPKDFLKLLRRELNLEKEDLVAGGKYHNFSDFFTFPNPGKLELENPSLPPLKVKSISQEENIFELIKRKDISVHYPYNSYNEVIRLLNTAAEDPHTKSIKITQYRVAKNSEVVKAMIKAARNGKDVVAFVELKARFDEESNIQWAEEMERAGVKVHYSFPGLKVHAKIALIQRDENGETQNYCYLATGNFNEKTAKIYSDFGLFTADVRLTNEVQKVFEFLTGEIAHYDFEHLLVAQFNMRNDFIAMIDKEIENSKAGIEARIVLKMNSLEDKKMISKLYEAGRAGVKIDIIVRGICCLVPGIKEQSENISVISIVDRFLEHSRFYIFYNGGDEKIYAASADWMKRNLSRRVEVAFPIYDESIRREINALIDIQLSDNVKARVIDKKQSNKYKKDKNDPVRSQTDSYNYIRSLNEEKNI